MKKGIMYIFHQTTTYGITTSIVKFFLKIWQISFDQEIPCFM
jgi:hypothetical protein